MPHLIERFAQAVTALVGDGPVKQRLCSAFTEHLGDIDQAALPPGLRRDFEELAAALNRVAPVGSESRVRASVQKMSAAEAGSHAGVVVRLYAALLLGQTERAEPLKVVSSPKKAPRYLTGRS
jgi:hypothetical protein